MKIPGCINNDLHDWAADGYLEGQQELRITYFATGWTCKVCGFKLSASRFGWEDAGVSPAKAPPRPAVASRSKATIWSDGACSGGHGGWAAVIRENGTIREISGRSDNDTTSQRMEVRGALEGLRALAQPSRVTVVTDSAYLADAINDWIWAWSQRGWQRVDGQELKNVDLWQEMWDLLQTHDVRAWWTRGHSGDVKNERADELASIALVGPTAELGNG